MDGTTAYESTHHLLLALAGRVDDDLLGWARELVSVGEEARAISLLTAEITASHTVLPEAVRAALVAAGQSARVDIDSAALAPAADDDLPHRFAAAPAAAGVDVAAALRALPARRLQDCTVHVTWRLTPAGAAPGPLPHPVVLVEIEPDGRALDVLAYQVAVGLGRAGVHASVEVLGTGQPRPAYHEDALAQARPVAVRGGAAVPVAEPPPVAAVPQPEPERLPEAVTEVLPEVSAEVGPAAEEVAVVVPLPAPTLVESAPDDIPEDIPQDVADEDEILAGEEEAEEPEIVLDPDRPHPFAESGPTPPTRQVAAEAPVESAPYEVEERSPLAPPLPLPLPQSVRPIEDAPALSALDDPLNGPLSGPLLPPRFDPTIQPHDPLGVDYLVGPSEIRRPPPPPEPVAEVVAPAPEPVADPAPAPASAEEGWAAEWASGAWAMSDDFHGDLPESFSGEAEFVPEPSEPVFEHRPRHSYLPEPVAAPEPSRERAPERAVRRQPEPEPQAPGPAARPESSARLSDADRELLARLQAELSEGRKPRVSRRAGVSGPARTGMNGRPRTEDEN